MNKLKIWMIAMCACGSLQSMAGEDFYTPAEDKKGLETNETIDAALSNVLIIGDSISIGYTKPVIQFMAGKANVRRVKSNCGDTDKGVDQLDTWLGDTKWEVIHFNFGLHDLYALTASFKPNQFKSPGDVHYSQDGYAKLAAQVAEKINEALETRE